MTCSSAIGNIFSDTVTKDFFKRKLPFSLFTFEKIEIVIFLFRNRFFYEDYAIISVDVLC